MDRWLPGAIQTTVVTAPLWNTNSRTFIKSCYRTCVCRNFGGWIGRCMGPSKSRWWLLLGSRTAPDRKRKKLRPPIVPLLQSWQMERSLPGVMLTVAVIAPRFNISSRTCNKFRAQDVDPAPHRRSFIWISLDIATKGPTIRFWAKCAKIPVNYARNEAPKWRLSN